MCRTFLRFFRGIHQNDTVFFGDSVLGQPVDLLELDFRDDGLVELEFGFDAGDRFSGEKVPGIFRGITAGFGLVSFKKGPFHAPQCDLLHPFQFGLGEAKFFHPHGLGQDSIETPNQSIFLHTGGQIIHALGADEFAFP